MNRDDVRFRRLTADHAELCRARAPIIGVICQQLGLHDVHEVNHYTAGEGTARVRWVTCDLPDIHGRPCLRVRKHAGECAG